MDEDTQKENNERGQQKLWYDPNLFLEQNVDIALNQLEKDRLREHMTKEESEVVSNKLKGQMGEALRALILSKK